MLKLSSIEICATSNVNRAWQIASQRLPFESGINSGIRKRCSTCFLQRAIIKIRPIFLARVDEKLDRNPDAFPLIFYSFELHIEILVDFDLLALYVFYTRLESSTLIRPFFIKERLGMWSWMLLKPDDLQSRGSMEDKILNSRISIFQPFKRKKVLLLDLLFCF